MNTQTKNPVIIVPGFNDKVSKMKHIEKYLLDSGWNVYLLNLTNNSGRIGIDELAIQLDNFIKQRIQSDQKFNLRFWNGLMPSRELKQGCFAK